MTKEERRAYMKIYTPKYRQKNRERINAQKRAYAKNNPEKIQEWGRKHYAKNPRKAYRKAYGQNTRLVRRERELKQLYDLELTDYLKMLDDQQKRCKICLEELTRIYVDHIHGVEPVVVRGLLCHRCNTALGLLK